MENAVKIEPSAVAESFAVGSEHAYVIKINNSPDAGTVVIKGITAKWPYELVKIFGISSNPEKIPFPKEAIDLDPSDSLMFDLKLHPVIQDWSWIRFKPATYEVGLAVTYSSQSQPSLPPVTVKSNQKLQLYPDFSALLLGAISGCAFIAVFMLAYRTYKYVNKMNNAGAQIEIGALFRSCPPHLLETCLFVLVGSLAAFAALILAEKTKDFTSTLSVDVHDVWGGFALGLLSIPLIETVFRFIQNQK